MGCAGSVGKKKKKYQAAGPENSTYAVELQTVLTVQVSGDGSTGSKDFVSQKSDDTLSSGPPPKGPAQILHEGLLRVEDVWAQGQYDLCLLSREGKTIAEREFEEKALQCAERQAGSEAYRLLSGTTLLSRMLLESAGIVCRKGRCREVPNQDSVLYLRSGSVICCGLADGFGACGSWASDWVVQCAMSLLLSEVCRAQQPGETPVNCQDPATLPSNYTMSRIYHIVHDALVKRAGAIGEDIGESGASLSLCLLDLQSREVVTAWIGDAHCIVGQADGSIEEVLTQVDYESERESSSFQLHSSRESIRSLKGYNEDINARLLTHLYSNPAADRRFGSQILHDHGGSHLAEVRRYILKNVHPGVGQFLMLATNGIWDALESQETAMRTIAHYGRNHPEQAVQALAEEARATWNHDEEDEETDDISVILVWL
mmetsp:Transcript_39940/g.72835  ORF Transcript_39940/g.72835 Transcript_39940/m.72835 type:complete len:430 (+) Transcript_39940:80-1369(+)